jgi:tetratricopeptide (TPR) repeat protein
MRQVISAATLIAGLLLQAAPAFAQVPPWAQQERRRMILAPQHAVRPAPQHAPQQQIRQQQVQPQPPKAKPEPIQNVAERAACLNKDTPHAALIAARTVVIEAGKDKSSTLATMYFNRGDAYREKGDLDNAIKDLGESLNLDNKNAAAYVSRAAAYRSKSDLDNALADLDQAIKADPRNPSYYSTRSHVLYEKTRLRARHRRPHPGDQAQSEEHTDDLQPRDGVSRCRRAGSRGARLRCRA